MPAGRLAPGEHLYLIDGSAYIFRAYHALPPLTRKSDGLPVGAVSGFCNMLYKLLEDTKQGDKPTHLAVILDYSSKSFRNDLYDQYKANRPEPPEDLRPQFPLVRNAVRAFNVACVEMEGFEADDLIATYAAAARDAGARVTIVSSDKDLMQLVEDGKIELLDTMKNRRMGAAEVEEKFGVGPEKVIEVQALAGDSVDNVPGVPGIGVKTAAQLIGEYGDVETLLQRAEEIKQPKRRQALIEHADNARLSRELVTLKQDVPVEVPLEDFAVTEPEAKPLFAFLKAMEFNTLTKRLASALEVEDLDAFEADPELSATRPRAAKKPAGQDPGAEGGGAPGAVADRDALEAPIDATAYETVTEEAALAAWIAAAQDAGVVAIDTETDSLDAAAANLVGISLAVAPGRACYIPLGHGPGEELDLEPADTPEQLPLETVRTHLAPLLTDAGVLKVAQNAKYDLLVLKRHGLPMAPVDDTMLLSYALAAGAHGHGMDELSELHLGHKPIAYSEVVGTGKKQISFAAVPLDQATAYAAEDADVTLRLHGLLKPQLAAERVTTVYETLERPMIPVLSAMEEAGIKVDRTVLARLSAGFAERLEALEGEIHALAGEPFNIGSPKQLGEILFGKMGLEGAKKTKTGAYQTGADVLEQLAAEGHDLPARVLDWRQLAKLKSTYTDALPEFINPETGRVHTSYSLASTTTGRLSSSDPNLQNIPIRTEEGREIRTAFVAEKGNVLLSADYSQIELRVLAHIADIEALKDAFAKGLDIHAMTASEMFGVPVEGMDPMVRRRAKAINFGIIYGISAFGLSNQLRIPRGEAQSYIETYFERFPGIRAYMKDTKAYAHEHGQVETLFGRKIHVRGIDAKQPAMRAFAERAAINAPIQGTAADIIRRAMIRMPQALADAKHDARMLLQVHDELVFEVPKGEAKALAETVAAVMEEAAEPARSLSVPLKVDANWGSNWDEAH